MRILGFVPCFLYVFSYVLEHWYELQCNRTFSNDLGELRGGHDLYILSFASSFTSSFAPGPASCFSA